MPLLLVLALSRGRGRGGAGGGAAYIKISEAEIADDYPMPQQYKVSATPSATECLRECMARFSGS